MTGRRRRTRLTPPQRRERFVAARERWAATLPPELRAEFEALLNDGDALVRRGWQLRASAFALARQHVEGGK